jgi:anti-sigma factor RsiW
MTCPDAASDLGAYALGALEPAERRRVDEHLRHCPSCAAELAEFAALPGLLARVDPADLHPGGVTPSPDLFARMSAAARQRPRRRMRTLALVAAAVLVVAGAGAGVAVWVTGAGEQTVTATAGAVRATITASTVDDGSALVVSVAGMQPGETCRLVAVDRDGTRHPAGVWAASPNGDGTWRGWAEVEKADLAEVVLLGDRDRELVRVPF